MWSGLEITLPFSLCDSDPSASKGELCLLLEFWLQSWTVSRAKNHRVPALCPAYGLCCPISSSKQPRETDLVSSPSSTGSTWPQAGKEFLRGHLVSKSQGQVSLHLCLIPKWVLFPLLMLQWGLFGLPAKVHPLTCDPEPSFLRSGLCRRESRHARTLGFPSPKWGSLLPPSDTPGRTVCIRPMDIGRKITPVSSQPLTGFDPMANGVISKGE